jgi:mono/diheme cytochrome c family protein
MGEHGGKGATAMTVTKSVLAQRSRSRSLCAAGRFPGSRCGNPSVALRALSWDLGLQKAVAEPGGVIMRFGWVLVLVGVSTLAFAADKKTERLFNAKCGSCHGKDGKAQTDKGKEMKMRDMGSDEFQKASDEDMKKTISEGFKKTRDGTKQEMDGFKDDLKPPEIDALVQLVRGFKR